MAAQKPLTYKTYIDFMVNYGPGIRYHNENLEFERKQSEEHSIPVVRIFGVEHKVIEELDTTKFDTKEELLGKIEAINKKQCSQLGLDTVA